MNNGMLRVRAARPDDLDEIVRLCAAHAEHERVAYDAAGKSDALRDFLFAPHPRLHCLVAERESGAKLAGYASWSLEASTWHAGLYGHMDCLYLDPDARRRGVGRLLMGHIAAAALAGGAIELQWQTPRFNAGATRFYERLGAAHNDKIRFYLGGGRMRRLSAETGRR